MIIGDFSNRNARDGGSDGVTGDVPDPVDIEGRPYAVAPSSRLVRIAVAEQASLVLEPSQAEELAYAILTVIEHLEDLRFEITRKDGDDDSPAMTPADASFVDGLLAAHIPDRESRGKVVETLLSHLC